MRSLKGQPYDAETDRKPTVVKKPRAREGRRLGVGHSVETDPEERQLWGSK